MKKTYTKPSVEKREKLSHVAAVDAVVSDLVDDAAEAEG